MTHAGTPDGDPGTHPDAAPDETRRLIIVRAAAYGLLLGAPAALANVFLADQEPEPEALLNLTLLVLLVAFAIAGFAAGHGVDHDAAQAGALAAVVCFVPVQVIGILGRLDRGDSLAPVQIVFLAVLAAVAGTIGAMLGAGRRSRRDAHAGAGPGAGGTRRTQR